MNSKPYIGVILKEENSDLFINKAFYFNGKKETDLSAYTYRVARVINSFDSSIYHQVNDKAYVIYDKKVINKLLAAIPKKKNKYLQKIIISTALAASLIEGIKLGKNLINKISIEQPSMTIENQVIENTQNSKIHTENLVSTEKNDELITNNISNKTVESLNDKIIPNKVEEERKIIETISYDKTNNQSIDILKDQDAKNSNEYVFKFDYENRSDSEKAEFSKNNYSDIVQKYAQNYGLDPKIIMAIITQENAYNNVNYSNIGANGIMQIESIWYNKDITAFNFSTNSYETLTINPASLTDPEYSVHVGCMIFRNYYDTIMNDFGNTLSKENCAIATLTAYNKGIGSAESLLRNYKENYLDYRYTTAGGDNEYTEHVASYLNDGDLITFINQDNTQTSAYFDNLKTNTFSR